MRRKRERRRKRKKKGEEEAAHLTAARNHELALSFYSVPDLSI